MHYDTNKNHHLSSLKRKQYLQNMTEKPLDLLVIGGGVTGAGIALDGVARGLNTGLVEKQDFAAGTSSRSTKLIHGGLRYLKQGDIGLVRECGRERAIVYRNAPHIVIPEKMLLPIVQGGTFGKLPASVGIWIYDWLTNVKKEERRVMLSKEETLQQEPLLNKDILKGGALYCEYRTDDARLTIEIMKTASEHGALCANYAEVIEFIYKDDHIVGAKIKDLIDDKLHEIYAKKIVNAGGPWVDVLREKDKTSHGKRLHLTKGIQLVFPHHRFPIKQPSYFDVFDGRMIFAIPRDQSTYVGTTETDYDGILENPSVTKEDVHYLLNAVNCMFPSVNLTEKDIVSSWAGLRPLIHKEGKPPMELSRKDEIFLSPSGLISIAGGKLTGYRKMAERVINLVMNQLSEEENLTFAPCFTDQIVLSGGQLKTSLQHFVQEMIQEAKDLKLDEKLIRSLVMKYGGNTIKIFQKARELYSKISDPAIRMLFAELRYCIEEEMAATLSDFLIRRTGRLFFERETLSAIYPFLLEEMAKILQWAESEKNLHLKNFEKEYRSAIQFF